MKNTTVKALLLVVISLSLLLAGCDTKDDEIPTVPTDPDAPYIPSNPSPANGATDVGINPTLSWDGGDPNADDTVRYDIFFGLSSATPVKISDNQLGTYSSPATLEYGTNYKWYVWAEDKEGNSTHSQVWTFTTESETVPQEGIFAALVVGRQVIYAGGSPFYSDQIVARFDSSYAPCNMIKPLQADSVKCEHHLLEWQTDLMLYSYFDPSYMPFLSLDHNYIFDIYGSTVVPDLTDSITFPGCAPYVTNISANDTLPFTGFNVTWVDYCTGSVRLLIMQGSDSTGVDIMTTNDGSYDFSQSDLSPLGNTAGAYMLLLIFQNSKSINATGYDSRGFIWSRSMNTSTFYMK